MRLACLLLVIVLAGCTQTVPPQEPDAPAPPLSALAAPGATVREEGPNRTLAWTVALGGGGYVPLMGPAPRSAEAQHTFDVDPSVAALVLRVHGGAVAVYLHDHEGHTWCAIKKDQSCGVPVAVNATVSWSLRTVSLEPAGSDVELAVTLSPLPPHLGEDGTDAAGFTVHAPQRRGGEPTLAVAPDGRALVVAGNSVLRLDPDGGWSDVTPPVDEAGGITLDPFLVGDPVSGKIYVSQLAACQRISWTADAGQSWTSNPASCGGPDQHHQKLAAGPGPAGTRALHMVTMNLATWLATDEVVVTHARSLDDGLSWVQTEALVPAVHGMEPRAIGNVAVANDGSVHAVAYLCQAFNGAPYEGLGVGVSRDGGITWSWQRIAPGGGACEGIDPGIAVRGQEVHVTWWDAAETPTLWHASSTNGGRTWDAPQVVPTDGLRSFVLVDLAAHGERLAAAFLASPDTAAGPNQAEGWARWFPYVAIHNGTWTVLRLEDHPVQLGRLCMEGPTCLGSSRNLLDFIDVQFGPTGRVHVAYADGCVDCHAAWASRQADLRVAIEPA